MENIISNARIHENNLIPLPAGAGTLWEFPAEAFLTGLQKEREEMTDRNIELLSPAGDLERLHMAVAYGADAVYLAGTAFRIRSFAGNFNPEELGTKQ